MDIQNMLERFAGPGNAEGVGQAAAEHIGGMDPADVTQHLQTAANNATLNGQPGVAAEIGDLIGKAQSDPDALKAGAIAYVKANPQVLTHFAPSFAQGILNRVV